ncbi:type II secretion system secretin GspD [Chelatococcus sambhunathii]|uniref:Type II secretion system secretin GspD n=1 Tax=Chelatococcus sambhunathii TaxID=363953 RepID=A0ABU1DFG8_9HYPH|nr:type II secretion system secretin GspD [Chelatococcus sambhunathii]MDR4306873.1 type II secretion system secretin GspD [Chelatococcus sambhunathii]
MKAARFLGVGACLAVLAACATSEEQGPRPSLLNTSLFSDVSAKKGRSDTGRDGALSLSVPNSAEGSSVVGDGATGPIKRVAFVNEEGEDDAPAAGAVAGANYRLNFENADIRQVVQAVLGETLKLNYTMTEDVSGKVTISSPRALTGQELLAALESSLNANGFSMTKAAGGYRIAPTAVGGGVVDTPFATQPSYGVSVVPLRHVSANTMGKLVAGFVAENDGLRVDAARNAMVIRGPGQKRQEAVDAIMSFDADWMQNQAVGIYEVRRAQPDAVVTELNRVFDADMKNGAAGSVIQFKPISRLRAVMVVTKNPQLLKRAETWVRRLDRDTASGAENVFVYKARYRDAKELARIVTQLFRAGGDANAIASRTSNATPSATPTGIGENSSTPSSGSSSSGSSSSSSSSFNRSSFGQSQTPGQSGSSGQSAFNNPNFDSSGQSSEQSSSDSGSGDSIDLTSQAAAQKSNILVSADPANNAVVVYADGYTYQRVLAALRQLDTAPLQVAIQATIAEVTLNDQMKQGVQYFVESHSLGLGNDNGSFRLLNGTAKALSRATTGFSVALGSNSSPDVVIQALDQVTDVEILSAPQLVVAENQPANFQVGDEVPVQTGSLASATAVNQNSATLANTVEYKDTGVILNVTPRIGTNDAVTMQIEQEISAVSGQTADSLTPTISKRRVASNISVTSGQTVLLAGLISKRDERRKSGIPVLGDLPGVGGLFSTREHNKNRTELVVFIKPVVIRSGEDASSVANEFRSRLLVSNGGGSIRTNYTK